ncbi:hypothetical protein HN51_031948 [Arachis hypogaea]
MHKSTLVIKRVPMEIVILKNYSQIWIKTDELAVIVHKMIEFIPGKDRFHKMRRFTNCLLESEVVDFLSEGQYLESPEAVEFGRFHWSSQNCLRRISLSSSPHCKKSGVPVLCEPPPPPAWCDAREH